MIELENYHFATTNKFEAGKYHQWIKLSDETLEGNFTRDRSGYHQLKPPVNLRITKSRTPPARRFLPPEEMNCWHTAPPVRLPFSRAEREATQVSRETSICRGTYLITPNKSNRSRMQVLLLENLSSVFNSSMIYERGMVEEGGGQGSLQLDP